MQTHIEPGRMLTGARSPMPRAPVGPSLAALFRRYRRGILRTNVLFILENSLRLAQPLALGWAINDLLKHGYTGLVVYAALHLLLLAIGSLRRAYDTRAFNAIYTDLATHLVTDQRGRQYDVSRVAARSALSRAFVDFFERDIPVVVRSLFSVVGALIVLCLYDGRVALLCLLVLAPGSVLNAVYFRKTTRYSGRLHDELEREVEVVADARPETVRAHYERVGRWRVKLSDWEALNFGLTELFVLGLLAAVLVQACTAGATPGDILAVFRYVLMFVMGLDAVPEVVQRVSRLRDIGRRLRGTED